MPSNCISFRNTGYFSDLICDYLDQKEQLTPFFNRYPVLENFKDQLEEKKQSFGPEKRKILVNTLTGQYKGINISKTTETHIALLGNENTFTITTGHQLNLFTGPLYFLYKIISVIRITKQLQQKYSEYNFVPVYWMATEDHDFEEINFFNLHGKKFKWNKTSSGAVGELSTAGLDKLFEMLSLETGQSENAKHLQELFRKSYLEHDTLAEATRFLVNRLFGAYGLVIIDGNDKSFKTLFAPYMASELKEFQTHEAVNRTSGALKQEGYKLQVNPREINVFYLDNAIRERIVKKEDHYEVLNTSLKFGEQEILKILNDNPERFSPNVLLRPLFQEVILPNLCYVGGGGELAYWFQLKGVFEQAKVPFPILQLRNSALIVRAKTDEKIKRLQIAYKHLFLDRDSFINRKVREISDIDINFTPQKEFLKKQFKSLYELAEKTDASFLGAVKAQEVKQTRGLDRLEKRLLKAQKRKLRDQVIRITDIQEELFPNGSLQERSTNFSELFLVYGPELIPVLMTELDPFRGEFIIVKP